MAPCLCDGGRVGGCGRKQGREHQGEEARTGWQHIHNSRLCARQRCLAEKFITTFWRTIERSMVRGQKLAENILITRPAPSDFEFVFKNFSDNEAESERFSMTPKPTRYIKIFSCVSGGTGGYIMLRHEVVQRHWSENRKRKKTQVEKVIWAFY